MAVRPIDAVQVLNNINLHHRPTPVSEFESGFNNGLNQAMWEITHAPTLTPPNEPLPLGQLREMDVEKVWRGEWEPGNPICPICGKDKFDGLEADIWADWMPNFCPNCGAPMTDEAVEIIMERLEETT